MRLKRRKKLFAERERKGNPSNHKETTVGQSQALSSEGKKLRRGVKEHHDERKRAE